MNASIRSVPDDDSVLSALSDVALEIMQERDKTEREIKRLAEAGLKDKAWALLVRHLNIQEPKAFKLKAVK